ncbi:MAG: multicopper oxidase domain-containing protein, partial [Pseudonocardiales bacterium]
MDNKMIVKRGSAMAHGYDTDADRAPTLQNVLGLSIPATAAGCLWLGMLHAQSATAGRAAWASPTQLLTASAAALPLVIVAVWGALIVAARVRVADGAGHLDAVMRVAVTAGAASFAVALAAPLTPMLGGGGAPLQILPVVTDAAQVMPVALLAMSALFGLGAAWAAGGRHTRVRILPAAVAGLMAAAAVASGSMFSSSAVAAGPPSSGACPAGAPVRSYDVQSINVDMPLNRFGDHDPKGRMFVLTNRIAAVRAEEATQKVSIGLRDDAIQPLVIRVNEGECLSINYTNSADGGDFGVHVDGLAFDVASSGDAVGRNPASSVAKGQSTTYNYFVPSDPTLEGAHYLHAGAGFRDLVNHGLFGSVVVEPPGSTYLDPNAVDEAHGTALESGWESIIRPAGHPEFRENVQLYHEIGNENEKTAVLNSAGVPIPFIDPHTDAYRPGTRAMNYRSEPFYNRLELAPLQEAHSYGSYTFGDPATPMPRGYLADPTKFRILHAGSEMFHVFHMHGGGIRWRFNPVADPTYYYGDTGLNKHPIEASDSERLDSQAFGPGESYNLEIEGGAGGVQQGAGDFLFHCHIAEHYVAGMWSFWRVYNTRQSDFAPLADRTAPSWPVDSTKLIGRTYSGQKVTAANLASWIN